MSAAPSQPTALHGPGLALRHISAPLQTDCYSKLQRRRYTHEHIHGCTAQQTGSHMNAQVYSIFLW